MTIELMSNLSSLGGVGTSINSIKTLLSFNIAPSIGYILMLIPSTVHNPWKITLGYIIVSMLSYVVALQGTDVVIAKVEYYGGKINVIPASKIWFI